MYPGAPGRGLSLVRLMVLRWSFCTRSGLAKPTNPLADTITNIVFRKVCTITPILVQELGFRMQTAVRAARCLALGLTDNVLVACIMRPSLVVLC